ncbi:MAG: PAS domain-containing protein [Methanobacterium sp.]|nr:PAS domain-containing protein [Methanobacterium sp.]
MKDAFIESEKSLQDSEKKYRRWFEDDLTGDFITTSDGLILECNPAFIEIYGFDDREMVLNFDISKFNPEDWAKLKERIKSELKITGYQSWHIRPDNRKIHVISNYVGIFNESNELVQIKGYIFDDTERKKAEESLKESERKYRLLFDEDLTGDFIATIDGKIMECNPAFASIYGFDDCNSALKWNISESNPFDWPFLVTRLKSERKILGYQSWQRRSDGLRIHVVANLMGIFNESNELVQVKGYIFDDTDRKRTEQELVQSHKQITEILDSIQDGFVAINHYWQLIYVNKRAAEYVNVEPEDLIGQNIWERFPEIVGTICEKIFRKTMEEDQIQYFDVQGIINVDKLFKFSVYPFTDGIAVYWIDITQ